jgi:hypothetical protein
MPAVKTSRLHGSALSWLLLGVWLTYSAAMLWDMKLLTVGATSMCRYVPPK